MTTPDRQTSTATLQIQKIAHDDRRVTLTAIPLLRNGEWGKYPASYYVWKDSKSKDQAIKDAALLAYNRASALKDAAIVKVTYVENPNPEGPGFFKNVLTIDRPDLPNEPKRAPAAVQPPNPESEALWDEMGATSKVPPTAPTMPKGAPAAPRPSFPSGDPQRVSIEAQVALKAAVDILGDILPTVDGEPDAKMAVVRKYLPELTMLTMSAIQETKRAEAE